jgi:hypothetical protein
MSINGNKKTDAHDNRPDSKSNGAAGSHCQQNSTTAKQPPKPPNWVEKGTLLVLIFTFFAAVYAGVEAGRLADLTQSAMTDAKALSDQQRLDTQESLRLTRQAADAATSSVIEAKRFADAAKIQADAATNSVRISRDEFTASQRAWVGPTVASMASEPTQSKPIEITIKYQNNGKEPAINFTYTTDEFFSTDSLKEVTRKTSAYMDTCMRETKANAGQVVYPMSGFNSYTLVDRIEAEEITSSAIAKNNLVVVQGCFLYKSLRKIHHSYFCYFYQVGGMVKIDNLAICPIGQYAD